MRDELDPEDDVGGSGTGRTPGWMEVAVGTGGDMLGRTLVMMFDGSWVEVLMGAL